MAVPLAYLCIIIIWSTTPLALKWSTEDVGFLFGAVSRMSLGFLCVMIVMVLRGESLRFNRPALKVYASAALGIYCAMLTVYWGAQFIPSGWIAIVFGLSPLFTTVFAALILHERSFTASKALAQAFGIGGLALVFYRGLEIGNDAALGIAAILLATAFHSLSAVLIKRVDIGLPAMTVVAGGLSFAVPAYFMTWLIFDGSLPEAVPDYVLGSILYLGIIATTVGFALYYYILKRQSPTKVALITFVSPIVALTLGNLFNGEAFDLRVLGGAGLVLVALFLHEILPALRQVRHARRNQKLESIKLEEAVN